MATNVYTYYAITDTGFDINNPLAIVRRRIVNGAKRDESFTKDMKWEHSNILYDIEWGHSYHDFQEISKEQADAVVSRWLTKNKAHPESPDEPGSSDQSYSE